MIVGGAYQDQPSRATRPAGRWPITAPPTLEGCELCAGELEPAHANVVKRPTASTIGNGIEYSPTRPIGIKCSQNCILTWMPGQDRRLWTVDWRRLRWLILDRDNGLCQIKGPTCTRDATQVDHIIARVDGGDMWQPANLRAACRACNSRGGAERTNQLRQARYRTTMADCLTRM